MWKPGDRAVITGNGLKLSLHPGTEGWVGQEVQLIKRVGEIWVRYYGMSECWQVAFMSPQPPAAGAFCAECYLTPLAGKKDEPAEDVDHIPPGVRRLFTREKETA